MSGTAIGWSVAARTIIDARRCRRARGDGQGLPDCAREAGITVNKNTIPFETARVSRPAAFVWARPPSHARMKEQEMAAIADMISEVLLDIKNVDAARKVRQACLRVNRKIFLAV